MKTLLERIEEAENTLKELKELALKEDKKDNFPKTWEGLEKVSGFYLNSSKLEASINQGTTFKENKDITPTEKEALSYLAACKLRQLAKVINDNQTEDEWVDWNNERQVKYYATYCYETKKFIILETWQVEKNSIYFKRYKNYERSLKEHKELWLTYFKVSNND